MQYACAILSSATCPALIYFNTSYHQLQDFWKEVLEHTCFRFLYTFAWNISHSKKNSEILSNSYIGLPVKYPLFFSDCNETWIFWTDFRNMLKSNFMKILSQDRFSEYAQIKFHENPFTENRVVPCGRTDGRSNTTELIVASRTFVSASKNAAIL